jgi:hypothetical protein
VQHSGASKNSVPVMPPGARQEMSSGATPSHGEGVQFFGSRPRRSWSRLSSFIGPDAYASQAERLARLPALPVEKCIDEMP